MSEREALKEAIDCLKEITDALRINAPGTPLNNHRFDALGIRAHKAIDNGERALTSLPGGDAVLRSLLEPSEAMIDAGRAATAAHLGIEGSALTVSREKMRRRFVAMINHALAAPPAEPEQAAGDAGLPEPRRGDTHNPASIRAAALEEAAKVADIYVKGAGTANRLQRAVASSIAAAIRALGEK
jgi:hypothetical protein